MLQTIDVENWFLTLNWEDYPNYQKCHRLEFDKFNAEYFRSEELNSLINNIKLFLAGHGSKDVKFSGNMGAGKTTFLHYLRKSGIVDNSWGFYIIRAGKISLTDIENSLKDIFVKDVYKIFFKEFGEEKQYDRIDESHETLSEKFSELHRFFLNNFRKEKLIIILDDLDTILDNSNLLSIINTFKRLSGTGDKIAKWVSLRYTTYDNYPSNIQQEFTFFQQPFDLPNVPLYHIINKRINAKNGENAKNPYSFNLCENILKLNNGSVRDSLGLLSMILQNTKPPKQIQSEEFIQNWFEKSAWSVLLKAHIIPNLHIKKYHVVYDIPLAFYVVNILKYLREREDINKAITQIINKYFKDRYIKSHHLESIYTLLKQDAIIYEDELTKLFTINEKGLIIVDRIGANTYNEICKTILNEAYKDELENDYWKNLNTTIEFKMFALGTTTVKRVRINN